MKFDRVLSVLNHCAAAGRVTLQRVVRSEHLLIRDLGKLDPHILLLLLVTRVLEADD